MYSQHSYDYSQRSDLEIATQCENTQTLQDAPNATNSTSSNPLHNKPKAWARLVRYIISFIL